MSLSRLLLLQVVVREVEVVAPAPVRAVLVPAPAQEAAGEIFTNLS